ncbi:MAG: PilZ domain-containing protein [Lachnospiraceae bacterium]
MEERRKNKRLDLDVTVQLERLDTEDMTTLKYVRVDVTDVSKTGIGFNSMQKLEVGTYYDVKIQIWTKEIISTVIEVVRTKEREDGSYNYGATFIGMTETDALKIEIYQIFNEL